MKDVSYIKIPVIYVTVKGQSVTNVAARYFIKKSQSSKDKSETFCSCPNHCRKSLNVTCNTNNNSYNTYKFS
jgi:hypothetical protein